MMSECNVGSETMTAYSSQIFSIVKSHVDKWDSFNLLCIDCPDDEYDGESKSISKKITEYSTVKDIDVIIIKVFLSSFGEQLTAEIENSLIVAKNIYNEIHKL